MAPRLTILTRDAWGGGPVAAGYEVPHAQFVRLIEHHDVIPFDGWADDIVAESLKHARTLKRARPDLGPDWPYSWGLAPDYRDPNHTIIVEGRGWRRTGAHTRGYNSTSYGVVLFGNYDVLTPTPGQLRGLRFLGRWLARPEEARETLWHKQLKATRCPGTHGVVVAVFGQPPFVHTDLSVFYPEAPVSDNVPTFNPPIDLDNVVDYLAPPNGGAWVLTEDGAVYAFGAPYFGGANGKPYFAGRKAARLRPHPVNPNRYIIVATSGETYGIDGF